MGRLTRTIACLALIVGLASPISRAADNIEQIPNDQAIRAIVGEVGGQGYDEIYATAHAIRNRGSLNGV